ncbi:MAG: hypothetical protein AAF790_15865 [Planctomycetota bacterium]
MSDAGIGGVAGGEAGPFTQPAPDAFDTLPSPGNLRDSLSDASARPAAPAGVGTLLPPPAEPEPASGSLQDELSPQTSPPAEPAAAPGLPAAGDSADASWGPRESTPINVGNTRHLAWVLGSKLSWASVGQTDPQGARQPVGSSRGDWQLQAIAQLLNVTPPIAPMGLPEGQTAAQAAGQLLADSRRLGEELATRHGPDHAALVEVAVKTNLLLLLYEKKPTLGGAIRQAVDAAAARADLPPEACGPLIDLLSGEPSAASVRESVFELHSRVERLLRTAPAGP